MNDERSGEDEIVSTFQGSWTQYELRAIWRDEDQVLAKLGRNVEATRRRAEELGARNVEVRQMEAEWIDLPTASVDGVLCRFGYMLMADPAAALKNIVIIDALTIADRGYVLQTGQKPESIRFSTRDQDRFGPCNAPAGPGDVHPVLQGADRGVRADGRGSHVSPPSSRRSWSA